MRAFTTTLGFFSLLTLFFLLFVDVSLAQDPECSASIPCKAGCCSKFGFCGYGKDYCHKDVCLNNCDRRSECDPGGFGSDFAENSKCPLNVCCSKHGFCGTTDEFCGDKKVNRPKCDSHTLQRVVGYYEGWAARRPCNAFLPEQIPVGVYTHLNFAFATIDPSTYEVRPASSADTKLYRRLTSLKDRDPDLKVLIAIGGWTFNDPGPTATTFSDIARSETAQKAFIKSLVSMMSTYDFDGVDLDWEYPQAKDRSGREEDFANFPKFIANLKAALKSSGRDEVSLTLPASMWYLKHFDIVKLEKDVDFFNIMSYDLHGTWDKGNQWVGPYLNAHTNLTEIKQAMDLLWRNDIDPDKVVLGTGFYGRAFTATSPNCLAPGCTYESGAPRQPCSNEISVMIQSEIVDVMKRTGNKPTLDKEAAVKILTFDTNQWVAYDDEDTFKLKANFAREQCMSGIMVWAVSADVSDGKYSKAIGSAAARKFTSLPGKFFEQPDDDMITTTTKHPQCKWTNCGESCPSGWVRMMRNDKEARKNEYLVDGSHCPSGVHELCCPAENPPTCGWYQHNNGKCDPTCPQGTVEVGSLKTHCNNGRYQAACCTTGGDSMKLHDQCSWTQYPMCMLGSCSSGQDEVVRSPSGSGNAPCNIEIWNHPYGDGTIKIQERKMCCTQEDNKKWDDCQWYNNLGPGGDDDRYCRSGCPSDRVRVAMDDTWNKDGNFGCTRGARAKCCIPKFQSVEKRDTSQNEVLRDALESFLNNPICSENGGGWTWGSLGAREANASLLLHPLPPKLEASLAHLRRHVRDLPVDATHSGLVAAALHDTSLAQRQSSFGNYAQDEIKNLVYALLLVRATVRQTQIWDGLVPNKYPNLQWSKVKTWVKDTEAVVKYGYDQLAYLITCHMGDFNDWVGGGKKDDCKCDTSYCCPDGGDWCASEESVPDDSGRKVKRENGTLQGREEEEYARIFGRAPGGKRPYTIKLRDGTEIEIESEEYYPATNSHWYANHPVWNNVYLYPRERCFEVEPLISTWTKGNGGLHYEHLIEQNTLARFFSHYSSGTLPSGRAMRTPRSDLRLTDSLRAQMTNAPPALGGVNLAEPIRRLFNALGSRANTQYASFTVGGMNLVKSALWTQDQTFGWAREFMSPDNLSRNLREFRTGLFTQNIRNVIVAINYLRDPVIWNRILAINFDIRDELRRLQTFHEQRTGSTDYVVSAWDEYFRDHLQTVIRYTQGFVRDWVTNARNDWRDNNDEDVIQFLALMSTLLRHAEDLELNYDDLPN
ncbi:class V chitinase, putative [Cordyceps militaris CM01]|uniref:chitinase n=1 Tax=Cordyceps militaris (strain CM01) TaxID=983644 RepID=G3JNF8_CORMM|nr:class V chitinase, putative [Cordyceps militaris CM01]EGX89977.1 class V chitinase, putative [Cordyceps militaris CM01]